MIGDHGRGHGVDDDEHRPRSPATAGAIGGLLATVTMTVYRLPVARSLPPTSEFWGRYGPGDGEPAGPLLALFLHVGYGIGGGIAFGAAFGRLVRGTDADAVREVAGLATAVLYGAALSVFGSRVLLGRLLGMDLDSDERLVFHVSHVVYALTLGTWLGSRTRGRK